MKCKVQWLDVASRPTPDDNEAIGMAVVCVSNGKPLGAPLPICETHARQLVSYHIAWPGTPQEVVTEWHLTRF